MSDINEFVSNKFCRAPGQSRFYGTTRVWSTFLANIDQIEKDISTQSNSSSAEKNEGMRIKVPGQSRIYGTTRAWSSLLANIDQIEKDISTQSNSSSAEENEAMKVTGHEDYNPDFADKEGHEDEGKMAEDPED